jgi:hypothetical protein
MEQQKDDLELFHDGTLGRCPNCGRLIMLPCLACDIVESGWESHDENDGGKITPELYGETLNRYQRIRTYRDKYGVSMFSDPLFVQRVLDGHGSHTRKE